LKVLIRDVAGAGLMLGSLFAGIAGPTLGWQFPFGVVGVTVLLFAVLTLVFMEDIVRGELERQATEYSRKPAKERVLTFSTMCGAVRVPTNVLLLLQALPNSLPWGILSTHMNDFLTQEKGWVGNHSRYFL
jgi:MFS family permease